MLANACCAGCRATLVLAHSNMDVRRGGGCMLPAEAKCRCTRFAPARCYLQAAATCKPAYTPPPPSGDSPHDHIASRPPRAHSPSRPLPRMTYPLALLLTTAWPVCVREARKQCATAKHRMRARWPSSLSVMAVAFAFVHSLPLLAAWLAFADSLPSRLLQQ